MMDQEVASLAIPNAADVAFEVRAYETGVGETATLPALCNYMQEAAGVSAERLGWGIRELQETGLTWMLSRLRVSVSRYAPQHGTVTVRTWPSGMKGRLVAKRCFLGLDENGAELFRASSEWLYVNLASQKIERLPETFADLVPPGTPDFELPDIGGKFAHLPSVDGSADVIARRSDLLRRVDDGGGRRSRGTRDPTGRNRHSLQAGGEGGGRAGVRALRRRRGAHAARDTPSLRQRDPCNGGNEGSLTPWRI